MIAILGLFGIAIMAAIMIDPDAGEVLNPQPSFDPIPKSSPPLVEPVSKPVTDDLGEFCAGEGDFFDLRDKQNVSGDADTSQPSLLDDYNGNFLTGLIDPRALPDAYSAQPLAKVDRVDEASNDKLQAKNRTSPTDANPQIDGQAADKSDNLNHDPNKAEVSDAQAKEIDGYKDGEDVIELLYEGSQPPELSVLHTKTGCDLLADGASILSVAGVEDIDLSLIRMVRA